MAVVVVAVLVLVLVGYGSVYRRIHLRGMQKTYKGEGAGRGPSCKSYAGGDLRSSRFVRDSVI